MQNNIYNGILAQKVQLGEHSLGPKKTHYVIRYIMGLTNVIDIQSNEHN